MIDHVRDLVERAEQLELQARTASELHAKYLAADRELRDAIVQACRPALLSICSAGRPHVVEFKKGRCEVHPDGRVVDIAGQVRAVDVARALSEAIDAQLGAGQRGGLPAHIETLRARVAVLRALTGCLQGLMESGR